MELPVHWCMTHTFDRLGGHSGILQQEPSQVTNPQRRQGVKKRKKLKNRKAIKRPWEQASCQGFFFCGLNISQKEMTSLQVTKIAVM